MVTCISLNILSEEISSDKVNNSTFAVDYLTPGLVAEGKKEKGESATVVLHKISLVIYQKEVTNSIPKLLVERKVQILQFLLVHYSATVRSNPRYLQRCHLERNLRIPLLLSVHY